MDFQLDEALAVLQRTPGTLAALLRGLLDGWTRGVEGADTWSAYDIVGHLLHGEEGNWIARAQMILEDGEGRPFAPFNRTAMFTNYDGYSLDQLLDAFAEARSRNLETLAALDITPEKLALTGTHPALGKVTLSQLLSAWTVHDLNHMGQIVEVMAQQYADAVGPWKAYLAILTRPILTE